VLKNVFVEQALFKRGVDSFPQIDSISQIDQIDPRASNWHWGRLPFLSILIISMMMQVCETVVIERTGARVEYV
jgi:hypothetical protein